MTRIYCTVLDKDHIRMNGETLMVCLPSGNGIQMENGDGKSAVEFNISTEAMVELISQMTSIVCKRSMEQVKRLEGLTESALSRLNELEDAQEGEE